MHQSDNTYSTLEKEIRICHSLILKETERNSTTKELYKGCQILFSPLIVKPEFLFIGFNPGGGYYKWHGKIVENFKPMKALEYYLNKHSLGEQTKSLFSLASKEKDLENSSVKINFYPWATNNIADFNKLMRLLPKELSSKLFHLSRIWTTTLINYIQPKTIICEGFKAFEEVKVLFPEKADLDTSKFLRSFQSLDGVRILGYKRNQGKIMSQHKIFQEL